MQFDFNLLPNRSQHIDVQGTFFSYKSGNGLLRVRLDGGGYIDLVPGQTLSNVKFNNVDIQDRTGAANAGTILAGMYDFRDTNVLVSNSINVGNDVTHRVPVTLDLAQTVAVTVGNAVALAGATYNGTYVSSNPTSSVITVFTPAQNQNGAYLEAAGFTLLGSSGLATFGLVTLMANAAPPGLNTDGDIFMTAGIPPQPSAAPFGQANVQIDKRFKIPAGKGLYIYDQTTGAQLCRKFVLYTLL